jgi:hypothetical protein
MPPEAASRAPAENAAAFIGRWSHVGAAERANTTCSFAT